jgi:tetratricopeptide (TPR) repeat protein
MDTSSDLTWCYQTLELPVNATEQEIKMAYRQLALRYHPDLNPGDREAEARFKQVALAYKTLLAALQLPDTAHTKSYSASSQAANSTSANSPPAPTSSGVRFYVKRPTPNQRAHSTLSSEEKLLKLSTLNQIYNLLKRQKWQQGIDVAENLANRFPGDPDVCQWLALTYQRWARKLIERQQYDRARIYLKKALQTDPHNQQLWSEIDRDYKNMERQLRLL